MTHSRAILCALAAFCGWVLVDTAVKLGGQADLSPFVIMGLMNITGVIVLLARAGSAGKPSLLRLSHPRQQAIIAADMIFINYTNVVALKHLPLTIFYIVVFTMPLAVALGSAWCKHEVLTKKKIVCLLTGFVGVLIVIGPRLGVGGEWIGYVAGLASVVGFVYYTLAVRSIFHTTSSESLLFWNMLPTALFGLICAADTIMDIGKAMLFILFAGGAINVLANALYNKALKHTTSSNVVQIHYSQIIFGPIVGYLLWSEKPTWNLLAGAVLIIAAGLAVARQARRDDKAASVPI